jgi:hypothetical protein
MATGISPLIIIALDISEWPDRVLAVEEFIPIENV